MALSLLDASHATYVEELRVYINRQLGQLVDETREPASLYQSVAYVLGSGGKRIRPLFVLLAAEMFDVSREKAIPAALAVEVFHNFTLVHDDIMDQSDERRGQPTVHQKWNTSTAILNGDLLLALSYNLLARLQTTRLPVILNLFHETMERLCEGQALDTAFETQTEVTVEAYMDMIERKTGALLQTALELGPVLGHATSDEQAAMRRIGLNVGRAFQIQDDLLDLTATDDGWGKPIGEDLMEGKKTYLLLQALKSASGEDFRWFKRIVTEGGLPKDQVPQARERMARLGVLEAARKTILTYYREALEDLAKMPACRAANILREVILSMQSRVR